MSEQEQSLVVQQPDELQPLNPIGIVRPPSQVLEEARKAAVALKDVIDSKPRKVVFNGETYLEYEDWQTVGRFYGVCAKVRATRPVAFGDVHGFEAEAEVVHIANGEVISAAEAMCLNDEPNWSRKPLFQLRSMAQTRACAKALRNVLAWVVVLAGYKPTPAEEMDGVAQRARNVTPPKAPVPHVEPQAASPNGDSGSLTIQISEVKDREVKSGRSMGKPYAIAETGAGVFYVFDSKLIPLCHEAQRGGDLVDVRWSRNKSGKMIMEDITLAPVDAEEDQDAGPL